MKKGTLVYVKDEQHPFDTDTAAVERGGRLWIFDSVSSLNPDLLLCHSLADNEVHHFWLTDEVDVP